MLKHVGYNQNIDSMLSVRQGHLLHKNIRESPKLVWLNDANFSINWTRILTEKEIVVRPWKSKFDNRQRDSTPEIQLRHRQRASMPEMEVRRRKLNFDNRHRSSTIDNEARRPKSKFDNRQRGSRPEIEIGVRQSTTRPDAETCISTFVRQKSPPQPRRPSRKWKVGLEGSSTPKQTRPPARKSKNGLVGPKNARDSHNDRLKSQKLAL